MVKLKGFDEYAKKLAAAPETVKQTLNAVAAISANNIANAARRRAPLDDGKLRASIHVEDVKTGWSVNVAAAHAAYMEFGTKSKVKIPAGLESYAGQFKGKGLSGDAKEAIYNWCRKHGIPEDRWYNVFVYIMRFGVKPQPFLFPSVEEERPKYYEALKKVLDEIT